MWEQDEQLIGAIRAGAVGYLLKNSSPVQLVSSLRSVHEGEGVLSGSLTRRLMKKLAVSGEVDNKTDSGFDQFTPREVDILRLLTSNKTNLEIAEYLYISENTVRFHIHSILHKLGLASRTEAAQYARQRGLETQTLTGKKPAEKDELHFVNLNV